MSPLGVALGKKRKGSSTASSRGTTYGGRAATNKKGSQHAAQTHLGHLLTRCFPSCCVTA